MQKNIERIKNIINAKPSAFNFNTGFTEAGIKLFVESIKENISCLLYTSDAADE